MIVQPLEKILELRLEVLMEEMKQFDERSDILEEMGGCFEELNSSIAFCNGQIMEITRVLKFVKETKN